MIVCEWLSEIVVGYYYGELVIEVLGCNLQDFVLLFGVDGVGLWIDG